MHRQGDHMSKYEIKSWRKPSDRAPEFGVVHPFIPTTKIFDNLTIISDSCDACFLLETTGGLILIDAMEPEQRFYDAIIKGIADIGYEPQDVKIILITHGHGDHYGAMGALKKATGAKLYMGRLEEALAKNDPVGHFPPMDADADVYIEDGGDVILGDTKVRCIMTPGPTQGCFSFIIPVTDEGRPHKMGLWGGTGLLPGVDIYQYLGSLEKYCRICEAEGVDGAISNHPPCDDGVIRAQMCREIGEGLPNPYVWTTEIFLAYNKRFARMCEKMLKIAPDGIVPQRGGFKPKDARDK